jgi:hypothetical protein
MTFSVEAALAAYIERHDEPRLPDGKWHPSAIWGCARKAVYEVRGTPPTNPRTPQNRRVLFIGSTLHVVLQAAISEDPLVEQYWSEVPIYDDGLNIIGKADGLRLMKDGSYEMDELKTISQRGLEYARKKGDLPRQEHLGQAWDYADALVRFGSPAFGILPLQDKLTKIRFCYLSKEDADIEEIVYELDGTERGKIEERITYLNSFTGNSLPPRMPMNGKKKHWMCDWGKGKCPFYTRCYEVDADDELVDVELDF